MKDGFISWLLSSSAHHTRRTSNYCYHFIPLDPYPTSCIEMGNAAAAAAGSAGGGGLGSPNE